MPATLAEMRKALLGSEKIGKTYKVKDVIGLGSQATVKEGIVKKTKHKVAIKVYEKNHREFSEEEVLREAFLMKKCEHEGVLACLNIYETKKTFELVVEFANVGEWLNTMILRSSERDDGAPYTEDEAKPVWKQLLSAVACLHRHQICHRDLKPENILVVRADGASQDDIQLKISDFGLAADLDGVPDGRMTEAYGSPEYAAPEIGGPAGYDVAVDLWSLGVISFMMLTGVLPYEHDNPGTLRRKVKNLTVDAVFKETADLWELVSTEAQEFVRLMLAKDPAQRVPAADLLSGQYLEPRAALVEEGEPPAGDPLRRPVDPVHLDASTDPELRGSFKSNKSGTSSPRSARSHKRLSSMRGQVSYSGCELPDDADIVVSVDIGVTGAKAVLTLIGRAQEELGVAFEKYETGRTTSQNGMYVEQQPEDWWNAFVRVTRRLLIENGVIGAEPRLSSIVICLSGQMQAMTLVSADKPEGIRPTILGPDTRAHMQAQELEGKTGNTEAPDSCLAKWMWLQQEASDDLAAAESILLGVHNYIAWRLSGNTVCDLTTASTTGLLDNTVAETAHRWCHGSLTEKGVLESDRLLPTLESATSPCTKFTDEIVQMFGLEQGSWSEESYVVSGSGTLGAATVGAGGGIAGVTYAHLGSSGWLAQTLSAEAALADPAPAGVMELLHPDPSIVIRTVSMLNAGDVVEWLADTEFASAAHAQHKHEVFASIDTTARIAPAGSGGVIFLPYLSGERTPTSDPDARGVYFGLSHETGKSERYRATLEGVAFSYRSSFEMLYPEGSDFEHLVLVGAGSNSSVWSQILADVLNVPVEVRGGVGALDVNARGNAMIGEVALDSTASLELPSNEDEEDEDGRGGFIVHRYDPVPAHRAIYDASYSIFRSLHPALAPAFKALAELTGSTLEGETQPQTEPELEPELAPEPEPELEPEQEVSLATKNGVSTI